MLITLTIIILISGICKGVQDQLMFHYGQSWTKRLEPLFWNPAISWRNKYKNGNVNEGAKFIGSTTIFVGFTDAWHLFGLIRENMNRLAIIIAIYYSNDYKILISLIIWIFSIGIFTAGFKLFYHTLNNKKNAQE